MDWTKLIFVKGEAGCGQGLTSCGRSEAWGDLKLVKTKEQQPCGNQSPIHLKDSPCKHLYPLVASPPSPRPPPCTRASILPRRRRGPAAAAVSPQCCARSYHFGFRIYRSHGRKQLPGSRYMEAAPETTLVMCFAAAPSNVYVVAFCIIARVICFTIEDSLLKGSSEKRKNDSTPTRKKKKKKKNSSENKIEFLYCAQYICKFYPVIESRQYEQRECFSVVVHAEVRTCKKGRVRNQGKMEKIRMPYSMGLNEAIFIDRNWRRVRWIQNGERRQQEYSSSTREFAG
ncbi:hypothetical protein BHM03_00057686 [Ensete ventricosum]|nr:hypothetical protein BHM03_00057686 [Ensete ventricosum]